MKKFNEIIFNKLSIIATEANNQGLTALADAIQETLEPGFTKKPEKYPHDELEHNVYKGLWKITKQIMIYHDVKQVNLHQIDSLLHSLTDTLVDKIESELDIKSCIGPLEPEVPGQK